MMCVRPELVKYIIRLIGGGLVPFGQTIGSLQRPSGH
jgi:hypothetical protein